MRLWGGRFERGPADALTRLSVSVHFDWRLVPYDLMASRAHARVLNRAGLLTNDELGRMLAAIDDLEAACKAATSGPRSPTKTSTPRLERGLLERLGSLGGKLRAGRSRNDQIATDLRLYLRDHVRTIVSRVVELETALMSQAEEHADTAAPGMTHLQHAQPVLLRPPAAGPRPPADPRHRPPARLGQARGRLPAGLRRAGRLVAAARPDRRGGGTGLRLGRAQPRWTPSPTATSPPSSSSTRP